MKRMALIASYNEGDISDYVMIEGEQEHLCVSVDTPEALQAFLRGNAAFIENIANPFMSWIEDDNTFDDYISKLENVEEELIAVYDQTLKVESSDQFDWLLDEFGIEGRPTCVMSEQHEIYLELIMDSMNRISSRIKDSYIRDQLDCILECALNLVVLDHVEVGELGKVNL